MMKNILITGGAGFIGSKLALKLLDRGCNITIMDNLSSQIHGDDPEKSSPSYNSIKDKTNFINGDINSREDWSYALKGIDCILHLAAETGTGQSMYAIENYVKVNIAGTALLLDILTNQKNSVKKVLLSSSRAIYGEGKYFCKEHGVVYPDARKESDMLKGDFENKCPICGSDVLPGATDEDSKIHPTSIYGITKQVQEQMILSVCKAINKPAVIYRYQNVYGPGQSLKNPYTGILSIFSSNFIFNKPIRIFEDGNESRDFVYIEDVVDATIMGIENDQADYQIFNVGNGESTSVKEVANILKALYQSASELSVTGEFRTGDIRHNLADISKIKNLLGFSPQYKLKQGIKLFAEWVKTQEFEADDSYQQSLLEMKEKGLLK
jgi:dTDP-L-rhamnose 4-epimerase